MKISVEELSIILEELFRSSSIRKSELRNVLIAVESYLLEKTKNDDFKNNR